MKSMLAGLSALAVLAGFLASAGAADNVFQPACFWRPNTAGSSPIATAAYTAPPVAVYSIPIVTASPPACSSCQQPQPACSSCAQSPCSTKLVQQSFYQPVTTMQTQTYYEPVTTYQTSSYYEPVTTLRTSYYFDPNCCSYQQVTTPETAYQLKTKSCPVQGYVARTQQVPVVMYQKSFYWQPQTTCCQTTVGGLIPMVQPPLQRAPVIDEIHTPNPNPKPNPTTDTYSSPQPQNDRSTPEPKINDRAGKTSWEAPEPLPPPPAFPPVVAPAPVTPPTPSTPAVRIDRIVLGGDASVEGQVVRGDNTPRAEVKVLFVNVNDSNMRETAKTNDAGRFQITLASGGWLVHIYNADGVPVYHSRVDVSDEQNAERIILVNR